MSKEFNLTLLDFIPVYPPIDDEELSRDLAIMKSLYDLRLPVTEKKPKVGVPLLHQKYMSMLFSDETQFTNALLWHGLGSGKTGVVASIIEAQKRKRKVRGMSFKPALVIVLNKDLERLFVEELTERYTRDTYQATAFTKKEAKQGLSEQTVTRRRNTNIRTTYELHTLEGFANALAKLGDEDIKNQFSYRDIFVDEAHVLNGVGGGKKNKKGGVDVYDQIYRLFHLATGGRKILLTGTPIWDSVEEFGKLMNLIVPSDLLLPTGAAFKKRFFDAKGHLINEEQLRKAMHGRVFYMRAIESSTTKIFVGMRQPWTKHVIIHPDVLSKFQAKTAKATQEITANIYREAREAATLVLPSGSASKEEFKKQFVSTKKRKKTESEKIAYKFNDEGVKQELVNNLRKYSANFYSTIKSILDNPKELCYVFNDFVTGVGGVISFALILEAFGFKWIKHVKELDEKTTKKRFIAITSSEDTTDSSVQIQKLIGIFSSKENMYGDLIQVIIGSEKISIGHNLKNVRQIHITRPYWNFSETDQGMYRALRFESQNDLPPNERYTKIFIHVAVYPATKKDNVLVTEGVYKGEHASSEETIDLYVLNIAQNKDYETAEIASVAREMSPDCPLTYKRNVLESDVPGSRQCNYKATCSYVCNGFTKKSMQKFLDKGFREEDLISAGKAEDAEVLDKDRIITKIMELLKEKGYVSLAEIVDHVGKSDGTTQKDNVYPVLALLEKMIEERTEVFDIYGFPAHIKEDKDVYYLGWNFSLEGNMYDIPYLDVRPLWLINNISNTIEKIEKGDVSTVLKYCAHPSPKTLDTIPYPSQIVMFETTVSYVISKLKKDPETKVGTPLIDVLLSQYGGELYNVEVESDDGQEKTVWIHNLYAMRRGDTAHSVSRDKIKVTGKLRVYDPETNTWSNTTPAKEESYLRIMKGAKEEGMKKLFKEKKSNILAVRSKKDKNYRVLFGDKTSTGLVVSSINKAQFINIFLNYTKEFPPYETDMSSKDIKSTIEGYIEQAKTKDLSVAVGELAEHSREELIGILGTLEQTVAALGQWLISWLKKKGLVVTM